MTDDGTALTTSTAKMLVKQGWTKVVVLALPPTIVPTTQTNKDMNRVVLADATESSLTKSLSSIKQKFGKIGAFIHLHPKFEEVRSTNIAFPESEKSVIKLVYFLAKHLKQDLVEAAQSSRSWFVALSRINGRLGFGAPPASSVLAGGLYGLIKTINIEWGSVFCRSVDFEFNSTEKTISQALNAELLDPDSRLTEIGYSSTGRVALRADIENLEPDEISKTEIDGKSVFLVAGGAKGVTATCIKELARRFNPGFILLGRSDNSSEEPEWSRGIDQETELKKRCMEAFQAEGIKPTPVKITNRLKPILAQREIEKTIKSLESAGSVVEYICADILDTDNLKKKLKTQTSKLGEITGIIHGAGVLADKLIEDKTEKDYQTVFSTKVEGLQSLLQCVSPDRLKHLVLFSSAAGFYGNEAQSDYATANEILNKFAHLFKQNYPSCHVVAFNWGPWDGGMVTPQLKRMFEERNIKVIPPEVGSEIMVDELALKEKSAVQIVVGNSMVIPSVPGKDLRSYQLTRKLDLAKNPFLNHHKIGTEPVLPIICALAWMADTCEKLYPEYQFVSCEETRVLKGIVFDSPEAGEFKVRVDELDKSDSGNLLFQVTISSGKSKKLIFHYSSKIRLALQTPDTKILKDFILDPINPITGSEFYSNGTLFHDSMFQLVTRQLNINQNRLTLACHAKEVTFHQQGQFQSTAFNPFADDIQLQALLIWARFQFQAASLPLSIREGRFFRKTPFDQPFYVSMSVESASESKLVATVSTHDENGLVYSQLKGAEVIISKALNEKFLKK